MISLDLLYHLEHDNETFAWNCMELKHGFVEKSTFSIGCFQFSVVRNCLGCGCPGHRLENCKIKTAREIGRLRAELQLRHRQPSSES
jgi:hypothetical protein